MSFATDLLSVMTGNSALNAAVTDGIYFKNIPDNTSTSAKFIVYSFSLGESIDHLQKHNEIDIFTVRITIVAPDTGSIDTILSLIRALLDNYSSAKFRDVSNEGIEDNIEGEREQYICTVSYKVFYQN